MCDHVQPCLTVCDHAQLPEWPTVELVNNMGGWLSVCSGRLCMCSKKWDLNKHFSVYKELLMWAFHLSKPKDSEQPGSVGLESGVHVQPSTGSFILTTKLHLNTDTCVDLLSTYLMYS